MPILPDLLAPNLRVVFCGTAAGHVSAARQAYYAGPGNQFWPVLFKIGLTPHQLRPEEYRELLLYGVGLTDLVKSHHGQDRDLPTSAFVPNRFGPGSWPISPRSWPSTARRRPRFSMAKV